MSKVIVNIGTGTDKEAKSRLAITLEGDIDHEEVAAELHDLIWRWLGSWRHLGVIITVSREEV